MEPPKEKGNSYVVVGMLSFIALSVFSGFILFMGEASFFQKDLTLKTVLSDTLGLNVGAPVFHEGIEVGRVLKKNFSKESKSGILVEFSIQKKFRNEFNSQSQVYIGTAGLLGDKTLIVENIEGEQGQPLEDELMLQEKETKELSSYLGKGEAVLVGAQDALDELKKLVGDINEDSSVNKTLESYQKLAKSLDQKVLQLNLKNVTSEMDVAAKKLNIILDKINSGEGTLGALVNDRELYEDLRRLLGGAERSKLMRFVIRKAISNAEDKKDLQRDLEP